MSLLLLLHNRVGLFSSRRVHSLQQNHSFCALRNYGQKKGAKTTLRVCGMDETGRGSVMGPLVICAVVMPKELEKYFLAQGVKDSKKLQPPRRETLYKLITETPGVIYESMAVSAEEIDTRRGANESLDMIEITTALHLLKRLRTKISFRELYVDALSTDKYRKKFHMPQTRVIYESKADVLYPCVSAASIIAKVERDRAVQEWERQLGLQVGSGYPSDLRTTAFLKSWWEKHQSWPLFVRQSWQTVKGII